MAVTNLTSGVQASAQSATTASVTPTANAQLFLAIQAGDATSTNPIWPTVTGLSLTWNQVAFVNYDAAGTTDRATLFLFQASGASPTTGTVSITFAASPVLGNIIWSLDQADGFSGYRQATTGTGTSGTSLTVTLPGAFTDATNDVAYGCFAVQISSNTLTPGTGFTQLAEQTGGVSAAFGNLLTEYHTGQDLTVDATWVTSTRSGGIALEIVAITSFAGSKTQPATARIQATGTNTQPATARVQVAASKTQPATARVSIAATKTQPATARIQAAGTKTQSAVASVQATRTKTQPATARVSIVASKTQPAVARVQATRTKTQPATANIAAAGATTKTQTAIARIQVTGTKTQPATARVQVSSTKTQSATARVSITPTKTQSAVARVSATRTKTQPAIGRIQVTSTKTVTAIARVQATLTKTQSATANIQAAGAIGVHHPGTASIAGGPGSASIAGGSSAAVTGGTGSATISGNLPTATVAGGPGGAEIA